MAGSQVQITVTNIQQTKASSRSRPVRRRAVRKPTKLVALEEDLHVTTRVIADHDLLLAVKSLYDDELRPYGRLVRKRLGEIAVARGEELVDGDLGRLRRTCEDCHFLRVEPGEGSEWAVLLLNREPTFVDVYSVDDNYPPALWNGIKDYLVKLDLEGGSLPGGRYSCARALLDSRLPFLLGQSLGQVCHIVQLAMSEKKLLGYLDGTIAPYERSNSMLKDTAAELCMGSGASQSLPFATWSTARSCMIEVLESAVRKGKKQVPISTLKRLFRSRFHIELSETALGYTKLSDLLQDSCFHDICSVQLLERGYVVLPGKLFAHGRNCPTPKEVEQVSRAKCNEGNFMCQNMVQNTFIQVVPVIQQRFTRRSRSVPKDIGSCKVELWEDDALSLTIDGSTDVGSTDVGSGSLSPTLTASPLWTPRNEPDLAPWTEEFPCFESWPMGHYCSYDMVDSSMYLADPGEFFPVSLDDGIRHFTFPLDHIWEQEGASSLVVPSVTLPVLSPELLSKHACDGSVVRKTFIELASQPNSPSSPRGRSQSVPPNMGMLKCNGVDQKVPSLGAGQSFGEWQWSSDSLVSPALTASPSWSPRDEPPRSKESQEPAKCVLCLSQFL